MEVPAIVRLLQPRRMQPLSKKWKRAHVCKSCQGTTPRPIVYYLPEVRSLFPIGFWRDPLRTHPDCHFVNELLHDISFGVRIGFNHYCTPCFPQITLPQPLTLRPSHRNWNANCPQTERPGLSLHLRFRILFGWVLFRKSTRSLTNSVSLTIFRGSPASLLTTHSPSNYILAPTTQ